MHILVTGGAGFIGSHLVTALVEAGHRVVSVDDLRTPDVDVCDARRVQVEAVAKNHTIDITDRGALETVFQQGQFDLVYHIAAKAGVRESITNPFVYAKTNYEGTLNVFELSRQYGVPRVVFASSSSVYGMSDDVPFAESAPAGTPVSVYAATKRAGELLAHTYCHLHSMTVTCLRFFTVYGPYGRPDMAPFIFTRKILAGEPIDVYNKGEQQRDFTYVSDIVDGCIRAIHAPSGYSIFNLGNGTPVALGMFIETLEDACGRQAVKNYKEAQQGDVSHTHADISRAKEILGYSPQVSLEKGIPRFVSWYKDFYGC